MKRILFALLVAILLSVAVVPPAFAQGGDEGRVIFGQDYTVEAGEELRGGLVVFGGDLTVEAEGVIDGDAAVFGGEVLVEEGGVIEEDLAAIGGSITIAGEVVGDVASVGGNIRLRPTAEVGNDVVAVFGQVERAEGAEVGGQVVEGAELRFGPLYGWRWGGVRGWRVNLFAGLLYRAFRAVVTIVALMALGLLVVALLPEQVRVVSATVEGTPFPSIGVGFLTLFVFLLLTPILFIVVCIGWVAWLLLFIALAAAAIYGWIVLGSVVGERLLQAMKVAQPEPLASVLLGVFLITLISATPLCIGFLLTLVAGSWGLGAVILTRFGTTSYPPPVTTREEAPPLPEAEEAPKPRRRRAKKGEEEPPES
ncbi:MAG: polymer-forming cytoskeletal protein [Anaerolineae bacterium]